MYAADPVPPAWWKLDEQSGVVAADSSGNGRSATVIGASWAAGKLDGSLSFDGASNYAYLTDTQAGGATGTHPQPTLSWKRPPRFRPSPPCDGQHESLTVAYPSQSPLKLPPGSCRREARR
jgi:hypothetical protein